MDKLLEAAKFAVVGSYTANSCSDAGFSVTLLNGTGTVESRLITWTGTPTELRSACDNHADLLAELPSGPDYVYDAFFSIEPPQDVGQGIGEVLPVNPTVVQTTCNNGQVINPSLTLPGNDASLVYTKSGSEGPGSSATVTATTQGTNVFPGILPAGWGCVSNTVAILQLTLDSVDYPPPTPTSTVTGTATATPTATPPTETAI